MSDWYGEDEEEDAEPYVHDTISTEDREEELEQIDQYVRDRLHEIIDSFYARPGTLVQFDLCEHWTQWPEEISDRLYELHAEVDESYSGEVDRFSQIVQSEMGNLLKLSQESSPSQYAH